MGKNINKYNILYRLFKNFNLLVSLIKDYWTGKYRKIPFKSVTAVILALLYVINPFDLIPDYILGFGQIDDALIFLFCLYYIEKDLHRYMEWKIDNKRS